MPIVHVRQTDDTAIVTDLLSRWKVDTRPFVRSDRMLHLVAWFKEQPVGVLVGSHDFGNWGVLDRYQSLSEDDHGSYVAAMFVDPRWRSQGAGSALLDAFIDQATIHQSHVVVAWPDEDEDGRDDRVRFFLRNGFVFLEFPGGVREPWLMGRPLR